MITLYRCAGGHPLGRESSKFLTPAEASLIQNYLQVPNPIMEVFSRGPIPPEYESRFGPPGHTKNPLYVASDVDTTFYEYGYHLLRSKALDKIEVKITSFEIAVWFKGHYINPESDPNYQNIMSISSNYSYSHNWLLGLIPHPDIIQYKSVRHPGPIDAQGINYAIFEKSEIRSIQRQDAFLIRPDRSKKEVVVFDLFYSEMAALKPKY